MGKVWCPEDDHSRKLGNDTFTFIAGDHTREENMCVLIIFRSEDVDNEQGVTLDDTKDED